jgi:microcystin-dependent protein
MADEPSTRDPNTTNLDLIVPTVGGSADVWGANLNTDLAKIDAKFAPTGPNRVVQTNSEGYPFGTNFVLDDATATLRLIWFRTAGSDRWAFGATNDAEGIGNIGSDFCLFRYDNTGAALDTAAPTILVDRPTGKVKFAQTPQVLAGGTYFDVIHEGNILTSLGSITEPVGTVKMYVGANDPSGGFYVICDGRGFPIPTPGVGDQTYLPLYNVIGTNYGQSGGNFLIPNTSARFVVGLSGAQPPGPPNGNWPPPYNVAKLGQAFGVGLHTLITSEIPSHTHVLDDPKHSHFVGTPSTFMNQPGGGGMTPTSPVTSSTISTTSSATGITMESTGGDLGHDNIPPALVMQFIIRVK